MHKGVVYVEKGTNGYQAVFCPPKVIEDKGFSEPPREECVDEPRYRLRKRNEQNNIAKRKLGTSNEEDDLSVEDFSLDISDFKINKNCHDYFRLPCGQPIESEMTQGRRMRSGRKVQFEI